MLVNQSVEKLKGLNLTGMAKALEQQMNSTDLHGLSFDDRLGLLIDHEVTHRENKLLGKRLKSAKLNQQACLEDIDYRKTRGVEKSAIKQLAMCDWVRQHRNVLVSGATGVGKTYITCALVHKACQQGFRAMYLRAPRLHHDLVLSRADGTYNQLLGKLAKFDLIAIDDFGLTPLSDELARDLLEVIDDRSQTRSTLLASQLPIETWHQTISNPTLADAILDRVVHNSYKLKLKGGSMRKNENEE